MRKLTYEYVKEQIEAEGYKLLSKSYKNAKTKLKIQCTKGHIYKVIWSSWQEDKRCPYCAGNVKYTYKFIKEQIEAEYSKLKSDTYKNNYTKLKLRCSKGHNYEVTWNSWQQGHKCPKCNNNNKKLTYEYVKEQIESEGYKFLSKSYKNCVTKLKIQCTEGHIYKVTWGNFQQGQRCPICDYTKTTSKAEKEILNIISSLVECEIISNDRTQITNSLTNQNLELDIYIPKLNKAIEFNGKYWHSSEYAKYKDNEKVKQCKEKNIDLLVINEQEWLDNKSKCIKQIRNWVS